jgi:hypothetical protein
MRMALPTPAQDSSYANRPRWSDTSVGRLLTLTTKPRLVPSLLKSGEGQTNRLGEGSYSQWEKINGFCTGNAPPL